MNKHSPHGVHRFRMVLTNNRPLAGRESVGLHDDRSILAFVEKLLGLLGIGKRPEVSSRNAGFAHQFLAEDLAAFELSRRL